MIVDIGQLRRLRGQVPKAAAKITGDEEELLVFYDYPAEHWVHLRTTNPIDLRHGAAADEVTKGHGSKAARLATAFKLIDPRRGHRNRLHVQQHEATKLEDPCGRCSRS